MPCFFFKGYEKVLSFEKTKNITLSLKKNITLSLKKTLNVMFLVVENLQFFGHLWKTSQESRKAALRKSHRLSRCRIVLTKRCHYNYCCHYCHYYYYNNLSFEFCHNFAFWALLQFEFLSFVTVWVNSFVTI